MFGLAVQILLIFGITFIAFKWLQNRSAKKITPPINEKKTSNGENVDLSCQNECTDCACKSSEPERKDFFVFYATESGTCKGLAEKCADYLKRSFNRKITILDLSKFDNDSLFSLSAIAFFILPTYTDGKPGTACAWFYEWLEDAVSDFRVDKNAFEKLGFAVYSVGDSAFGDNYGKVGKTVNAWLKKLGGERIVPLGLGDVSDGALLESFDDWLEGIVSVIELKEKGEYVNVPQEILYESDDGAEAASENDENSSNTRKNGAVGDLEDLAGGKTAKTAKIREMVNPTLHKALTKQGYKIVGSHSGVKLCRWTKAMLRNRGGCYKHSFYGIASHQCMETTPSLACANKCVFCWRHHTNPVGTEWKWKLDPPELIAEGALQQHAQMVKQMKGVPGADPVKLKEAQTVRHCALSLVGEPIMYPHINEFLTILHEKKISTFLVTNAQFPERIEQLVPITQLYVSVDAATKETLKEIDRPLFNDFWERFIASMDEIKKKKQRTVYRLTLVKAYNTEDISNYVELIERGTPDFVEVKGVTFCGYTGNNPLTMSNVPFHREVIAFVQELVSKLPEYAIACEHEHSCSLLIANKKFLVDSKWHTWIDYEKFNELVLSGDPFTSLDYMKETPEWAVFGDARHGFDPNETRWYRKKGSKEVKIEHGC